MIDKIKVNISAFAYYTLMHDMFRFSCFKPNGDINQNDFLNSVIINSYKTKLDERNELMKLLRKEAILTDISSKNKEKMISASIKVLETYHTDETHFLNNCYFMIYPTKHTQDLFDEIYENEIKNRMSISAYIRSLINKYVHLPQFLREILVNKDEYKILNDACDNKNIVYFKVNDKEFKLAPYSLVINNEETFVYLIGLDLNSKKLNPISIKLSKIYNIVVSKEKFTYSKDQLRDIQKIINHGVEFASGEIITAKIKVTEAALRMLMYKTHNRPRLKMIDENTLEVSCTLNNFLNYFIQFGKEIKILDNDDVKNRMHKFYLEALKSYDE